MNYYKAFTYYLAARIRFAIFLRTIKFLYQKYPTNRFITLLIHLFDPNAIRRKTRQTITNTKIQIKTNTGEILDLNLNEHIDWLTFLNGSFDDLYINLIQKLSEKTKINWKFIDIGANFGSIAIPIGRKWEVLAFEPQVDLFNRLVEHSNINNCSGMLIENLALSSDKIVSETKGIMHLHKPPGNSGATSYNPHWNPSMAGSELIEVQVTTLDTYLRDTFPFSNLSNIIVKIDVEGSELSVLQGAINFIISSRPIIILEYRVELLKEGKNVLLEFLEALPSYSKKRLIVNSKTGQINAEEWNFASTSFELALVPNENIVYF
jgi:FkbM family methyltransferase